ncbi:COG4315 family predicted lipoprotein [Gallaecimonas mangrovi]|uniref:COG4315 family predicted lipoprotein n=1 Tax=Gallaecimonas mangrovi TaxID=2291597 RepID=UPI000E1FDCF7|nr:hypothetical protein [Gallaecimonas mangrovi]
MKLLTTLAATLVLSPMLAMAAVPVMTHDSAKGKVLTDAKGMTLYTFDKDKKGISNCNGKCAEKWPPLMAKAGAMAEGDYSVIKRQDGSMQWAYKGWPLYYWVKDKKPGDVSGDGKGGKWHLVHP